MPHRLRKTGAPIFEYEYPELNAAKTIRLYGLLQEFWFHYSAPGNGPVEREELAIWFELEAERILDVPVFFVDPRFTKQKAA